MDWRVRAIRGATTVTENTADSIKSAVTELLDELETHNELDPQEVVSVIFTATQDLSAIFPASVARQRPGWDSIPLLDVQQMYVEGSLPRCIRVLVHVNTPKPQYQIYHPYLRQARNLRPDLALPQLAVN